MIVPLADWLSDETDLDSFVTFNFFSPYHTARAAFFCDTFGFV